MVSTKNLIFGVELIDSQINSDDRGYFFEKYNRNFLKLNNIYFVQENISKSMKGTIRGLHWQTKPKAQDKLVTCITGEIFDVAIDLRKDSKSFGQYCSQILKGGDSKSLWIPTGFAHGFQALTDNCIITYSVSDDFSINNSRTINPHCPTVGIDWPIKDTILSKSDSEAKTLQDLLSEEIFF
jgi:dTDP-4-dehydrorhamnose 3,5-epimerase